MLQINPVKIPMIKPVIIDVTKINWFFILPRIREVIANETIEAAMADPNELKINSMGARSTHILASV
jgi:hypothetical protein